MRHTMHFVLYILAAAVAAFTIFLLTAVITDYRPAERVVLQDRSGLSSGAAEALPDSLSILCWNIGYGGLGNDMDFFYDGGTQVPAARRYARPGSGLWPILTASSRRSAATVPTSSSSRKWTSAPDAPTASTR